MAKKPNEFLTTKAKLPILFLIFLTKLAKSPRFLTGVKQDRKSYLVARPPNMEPRF